MWLVPLSGQHILGVVSAMFRGTTAQIAALTAPVLGAMAFDTTVGVLVWYNGSAWVRMGASYWSRSRAYLASTIMATAGASAQTLICGTEDYDSLGEYNTSTGNFTCSAAG